MLARRFGSVSYFIRCLGFQVLGPKIDLFNLGPNFNMVFNCMDYRTKEANVSNFSVGPMHVHILLVYYHSLLIQLHGTEWIGSIPWAPILPEFSGVLELRLLGFFIFETGPS